ncbi:MAG: thermonuclease family protein, partial [candidate division Zixibacteria bacterium]|nr:thermonuclease family protein [candidate division Zixibacteria bacterium]
MSRNNTKKSRAWAWTYLVRILILVLIVCTGYALYKQFLYEPPAIPEEGEQGLRMIRIIDGDTGELSSDATVRYLGIDTPESGEPFYFEASRLNTELCLDEPVRLEYDHRIRDKYERILA